MTTTSLLFASLLLGTTSVAMDDPPAPAEPRAVQLDTVTVEVDVTPLSPDQDPAGADKTGRLVSRDVVKELQGPHGLIIRNFDDAPDAARDTPSIVVVLAWEDYDNAIYLITTIVQRPGEHDRLVTTLSAECFTRDCLTAHVIGTLPAALEALRTPPEAEPEPVAVVPEPQGDGGASKTTGPDETGTPDEPSQRRPLGMLGKVGIGTGVGGLALLGAGAAVFAQGDQVGEENDLNREGVNFRPPGIGLMIGGGVAAVTGVVLLVVDRRRALKARPEVSLSPRGVSLGLTAHF